MLERFQGKTVIVTGSSSGIGEGCARRFASEGANVVLVARTKAKLDAVAASLDRGRTLAIAADVSKREDVARIVDATVERFGGIDVLHGNAGIVIDKPFEEFGADDRARRWPWTSTGCSMARRLALPHLEEVERLYRSHGLGIGLGATET